MLENRTNPLILAAMMVMAAIAPAQAADPRIGGVPVPLDIAPPQVEGPFKGSWFGLWGSKWRTILVVEERKGDDVSGVYAVGPNGDYKGGWRRLEGRVEGDRLHLKGPNYTLAFQLRPSGRLHATYNGREGFAVMSRGDLKSDRPWSTGAAEMLTTDLIEDGEKVRLNTVIYRPDGEGPFPLAIMNHGSTGGGDPTTFGDVWTNEWLADLLVEQGWIVAFPQRRGRGGSDGLYDEGFREDRSAYTCDAAPALAGAERALIDISAAVDALRKRPEIADGPVLIGGMSRGGALSVAWAGRNPDEAHGVVNFVGGWLGEGCGDAEKVNETLFIDGGAYSGETLWLYGDDDPFYSLDHSRVNFAIFRNAGGRGKMYEFELAGERNGHWVDSVPSLWQELLIDYLDRL